MRIEIQFFARLKDAAGTAKITRELSVGARVSDLLGLLYSEFPRLREWDAHIRVAVGVEWVARDHALRDGDAVSIMPPVSGG